MDRSNALIALAVFLLVLSFAAASAIAQDVPFRIVGRTSAATPRKPLLHLPDTLLVDQHGRSLRLASDAVADKVVVIAFASTECRDGCPLVAHTLAQMQQALGPLMEQEVRLLTLAVDPGQDTPARLRSRATQFGAGPGWLWLTGESDAVAEALRSFGVDAARPAEHPVLVIVGDPRSGDWLRLHDIDHPELLLAQVAGFLGTRDLAGHSSAQRASARRVLPAVPRAAPAHPHPVPIAIEPTSPEEAS